jgi:hypothetical protein
MTCPDRSVEAPAAIVGTDNAVEASRQRPTTVAREANRELGMVVL